MFNQRVMSGVQPTGHLHLGNYLGAIKNFTALQNTHECVFCIVDLHAITEYQSASTLHNNIFNVAATFIGCGIDFKNHMIFQQSQVSAHSELAWILDCTARIGWLNRMTQFKEKAGKNRENASVGLFNYPVLMSADILAYHASHVPVGEDQKQHLELTRDIAQKFNTDYGVDFFPLPEPVIMGEATRVMSLRDGTKKMSKSDVSDMSRINLTDSKDSIAQKIRKSKTDPYPLPEDKKDMLERAEATNLLSIYAALSDISIDTTINMFAGKPFSHFKSELTDLIIDKIVPIGDTIHALLKNKDYLENILNTGSEKARAIANPIVRKVHNIVGFRC